MVPQAPQWSGNAATFVDDLFAWYRQVGANNYDEQVTQLEHALQTAENARQDGAPAAEIVAALLHDIGHFLVDEHRQHGDFLTRDLRHEDAGAAWLARFFPTEAITPVRLHVSAKRWLCTQDARYWHGLSDASKHSLEVQGGTMSPDEIAAFEATPGWRAALALRQRDDLAKERGRQVPGLESFRSLVVGCLKTHVTS
jgi:phosphonate degradation associated HDIG domain protein